MKYKVKAYGPFGPNQSAENCTLTFDTRAEREAYLAQSRQLVSILKVWEDDLEVAVSRMLETDLGIGF